MTYQDKVAYLKSYQQMYYKLTFINNKIKGIQAIKYSDDDTGNDKSLNDYIDEKEILLEEMKKIEDIVNNIRSITERYTLAYRFLQFKKLEDVSEIMGYSLSQIKRFYKKGINMIPNEP